MMTIRCARCGKPVDSVVWWEDPVTKDVTIQAHCHGAVDQMVLSRAEVNQMSKATLYQFDHTEGVAFQEVKVPEPWEHLKPYGYAPGDYMGRCGDCGGEWTDQDKRSWRCRKCAEALHDKAKQLAKSCVQENASSQLAENCELGVSER